jgi:ABC-type lipoprotein release transport system permease subunit
MPAAETLAAARSVPGVLRPRMRVWGVAGGPQGVVTVIGLGEETGTEGLSQAWMPELGRAWLGGGVQAPEDGAVIFLRGAGQLEFEIMGRLPGAVGMAAHDIVGMHPQDARRLLGLAPDQASDLALDVFHEQEAAALVPDLASAFGWPVQIMTRSEQLERTLADISRRTGMILVAFGPALLALALVVADVAGASRRRRWDNGLLKALGWTGGELLRLQVYRGLLVGAPALAIGTAGAYGLLFWPGLTWLPRLLFEWSGPPPGFYLTAQGAAGGIVLSMLLAGVPFLAAVFWSGWQAAALEPADCIEGGT